jgi:hypothetical protein
VSCINRSAPEEHSYMVGKRRKDSPDLVLDYGEELIVLEVFWGAYPEKHGRVLTPTRWTRRSERRQRPSSWSSALGYASY